MSEIYPNLPKFPLGDLGKIGLEAILKGVKKIVKIGKYAWSVITGKDERQDEIASKKGFNPEKSEANEIAELNKLLSEYRQNIIAVGNDLEREMIAECSIEMQDIMDCFEQFNKDLKIARTESVKRKFRYLNRELKGTFKHYIEEKISLDNAELTKVLKLPAGDLKNQRLQEMKQNVFLSAKDEMIEKIKYTVSDFIETVEDAFYDHLERAEESIEVKKQAFEKMSNTADDNSDNIESVLLKSNYILSVCSFVDSL